MRASEPEVVVAADPDELAALAAELLGRAVHEAVTTRGVARVALSGGSTPAGAYRRLAALSLPWSAVEWYWVDERAVPPDSPQSNYGAAARELGAVMAAGRRFRMEVELPEGLEAAASRYAALLRERFGVAGAVAFDAMTLGVGEDGHTASLFPRTGAVHIDDRLVAAIPEQPARGLTARLTLTAPVIQEARFVAVLCTGEKKRRAVEAARRDGSEDEIPARLVQRCRGRVAWLLDAAAAPQPGNGAARA